MVTITSSERFRLGKALQQAARQNDAPTPKDDEIRFYFRQAFADQGAIQSWCAQLGKALGMDVEFTGGGHPMPKITHSNFQINARLNTDHPQNVEKLITNEDFIKFVDKSRNYNNQDLLCVADQGQVQDISDNNPDDWYPLSFTARKSSAPKMSAPERLMFLKDLDMNAKLLISGLQTENKKAIQQSYSVFFNLIKMVALRTLEGEEPELTTLEATTLYNLAQSIKSHSDKNFPLLEPTFMKFSMTLNGWNPAHQDVLNAQHLLQIKPKLDDHIPTLDS